MAEKFTNKLNIMSTAVESGCNRSTDVMCRLCRNDPCACAELANSVVYGTDMDPLSVLTKEQEVFILESAVSVDLYYLPDNCGSAISERENTVSIGTLFLCVVHQNRFSFLCPLFHSLDMNRQILPINVRCPKGDKFTDTQSQDKQ